VNRFVRKIRLKIRFVETITIVMYQRNIRFVFKFIFVNLIFNLIFLTKKPQ
jgi:hypothetical protein